MNAKAHTGMKTPRHLAIAALALAAADAHAADVVITSPDGAAFVPAGDPSCLVALADGSHEGTMAFPLTRCRRACPSINEPHPFSS
jgi:hypothetical protein